jgi:predicted MFS family arabinose efflux permease
MSAKVSDNLQRQPPIVLFALLLAIFVIPMSITGTAVALNPISQDLGTSPARLQWVVNAFNASFAIFTLAWGALSLRVGFKRTYWLGIVLVFAGSIASALAPTLLFLDFARALTGLGGAALATGVGAIISTAYSGRERSRAFGLFGSVLGFGIALGPTVSGLLIDWVGWRGVFYALAVAMLTSLLFLSHVPDVSPPTQEETVSKAASWLWNPKFLAFMLVPVAGAIGFITVLSYLPTALSAVHGMGSGEAGLFVIPMTIPVLVGPMLAAQLIHHVQWATPMKVIYVSLVSLVLGDLGLVLLGPDVSLGWIVLPMVLIGAGFGLAIGLVDGEALATVPPESSGAASGVVNSVRLGSEAIAVAVYAAVIAGMVSRDISDPDVAERTAAGQPGQGGTYADAFHTTVVGMAVLVLVVSIAVVVLHTIHTRRDVRSAVRS